VQEDPLLELVTEKRKSSELLSLQEASANAILRTMASFIGPGSRVDELSPPLLNLLLEKFEQLTLPDTLKEQKVVCGFLRQLLNDTMTIFDFKLCGHAFREGKIFIC